MILTQFGCMMIITQKIKNNLEAVHNVRMHFLALFAPLNAKCHALTVSERCALYGRPLIIHAFKMLYASVLVASFSAFHPWLTTAKVVGVPVKLLKTVQQP